MDNKPNLKRAAALSAAIAIIGSALLTKCAYGSPVTDQFRAENRAGTLFPADRSLDGWRACVEKDITFFGERQLDQERTVAYFLETGICKGQPERYAGVMMIWHSDGQITGAQWAPIEPAIFDLAVAGQAADVATTAAGLAAGLSEANPLGLAALPIKYAGLRWSKSLDLHDCIQARSIISSVGWGAAAWNVAAIAGALNPVSAAIGGIAAVAVYGPSKNDAPSRCVEQ